MPGHGMSATARHDTVPTRWEVKCDCRLWFISTTYASAEDAWRLHVYEETGRVVRPLGDAGVPRWTPGEGR